MAKVDYSKFSDDTLTRMQNKQPLDYSKLSDDELGELQKMSASVPPPSQTQELYPDDVSKTESFLRGAAQGASFGFADEISGGLESLLTDKTYEQARDESRANFKKAEEANPLTSMAGNLVGGVAVPMPFGAVKSVGKAALTGAAMGGVAGLGSSEGETVKDAAKDTLEGAAFGGLLGGAITGAGKAVKALSKNAAEYVGADKAIKAYEYGREGVDLSGPEARKRIGKELVDAAGDAASKIQDEIQKASDEQVAAIKNFDKSGSKVDISKLLSDKVIPQIETLPESLIKEGDVAREGLLEPLTRTVTGDKQLASDLTELVKGGKLEELLKHNNNIPAEKLNSLRKVLGNLAFVKDLKDKDVERVAKIISNEASEFTKSNIPGFREPTEKLKGLIDAQEILNVGKGTDELGNKIALTPLVQRLESETVSSDIARAKYDEAIKSIKNSSPELAEKIDEKLKGVSDKFVLSNDINKPAAIVTSPFETMKRFGGRAANTVGTWVDRSTPQGKLLTAMDRVRTAPEALAQKAERMIASGDKRGELIKKVLTEDGKKRNALMFTLMQQPAYRDIFEDEK